MAGLNKIMHDYEEDKKAPQYSNREIFLAGGQKIAFTVLSNGDDDNVERFYRHYIDKGLVGAGTNKGRYVYCRRTVGKECWICDSVSLPKEAKRRQEMFGFWAHIHTIVSDNKPDVGDWTERTKGRKTFYERELDELRVVSVPMGRNGDNFSTFVTFYTQGEPRDGYDGSFDRVLEFSRSGSTMNDTTYNMMATRIEVDFNNLQKFDECDKLLDVLEERANGEDEFFLRSNEEEDATPIDDEENIEDDNEELPF